jgi:hypothetical protein
LRETTVSFVTYLILPARKKTPVPLYGFSWSLKFVCCSKTCREDSSLIKILTRIVDTLGEDSCKYVITSRWSFLGINLFSDKFVEKIKTHILCSINIFRKNRVFYEIIWKKCWRVTQTTEQ